MKFPFCKTCDKCCKGKEGIYLSGKELKKITELGMVLAKKAGKLYQLVSIGGCCQFLERDGCSLKYKPLTCEIYPFLPTKRGWVIRTRCPLWDRFTLKDLEKVKQEFAKRKEEWVDKINV